MKYRASTLQLMSKINTIIEKLVEINNNNPYNMEIKITNIYGNELLGDNYAANVTIQFNEIPEVVSEKMVMIMEVKGIEPHIPSKIKIVHDKKKELLKLFEEYQCGKCAINFYEKGSHIEFLVSMSGYEQFNNIEVTCPGVNNETLTIGKKYYIFDLRDYKKEYLKYEKLIDIQKIENTTEYVFCFENIDKPFETYTRGNAYDSQKIMHRFDYIVFEKNKDDFIMNSLKLITKVLENTDEEYKKNLLDIVDKIIKL